MDKYNAPFQLYAPLSSGNWFCIRGIWTIGDLAKTHKRITQGDLSGKGWKIDTKNYWQRL